MSRYNPILVANWKMNTSLADAVVLTQSIKKYLENQRQVEVVLAPPFVWLYPVQELLSKQPLNHLAIAAQTMHEQEEGPFTGEISAMMLKRMCNYVLLGHSERMQFGETLETVNKKIRRALEWKLKPIVFVGEAEPGTFGRSVSTTLNTLLHLISKDIYHKIIFVYEPIWAISTKARSRAITGHELENAVALIRKHVGEEARILYGGSVTPDDCAQFLHIFGVNGLVVGNASLKAKQFIEICKIASETHAAEKTFVS